MMNKFMPYLLPVFTLIIGVVYFLGPGVTGFVVVELGADVRLEVGGFLPKNAVVVVSLDGVEKRIRVDDFIVKTGEKFEMEKEGFVGNYIYSLDISEFGLNTVLEEGNHVLKVSVVNACTDDVEGCEEVLSYYERIVKV